MSTNIVVPNLGESVTEATISRWMKAVGEAIKQDDPLVELETDKVTLEVNAPSAGILSEIKAEEGKDVAVGDLIGVIEEKGDAKSPQTTIGQSHNKDQINQSSQSSSITPQKTHEPSNSALDKSRGKTPRLSPAAQKWAREKNLDPSQLQTMEGKNVITKQDVLAMKSPDQIPSPTPPETMTEKMLPQNESSHGSEERVPLSRLRKKIAERLIYSQKSTATLTTFNEIDMTNVMNIRSQLRDSFEKKYGGRLGFMSFFVKAAIVALKEVPAVNGEIRGEDIIYKNYYDIGVAVGTPQGLVVPVVRNADQKAFSQVELDITHLAQKARQGKLAMEDMMGGTFTISNGGVYGSLLSTPILNPPQSGILGMHKIEKRPVVIHDSIQIRPMMYVALSYDHRIIDGTESVTFLKRVKECIENPERILLEV